MNGRSRKKHSRNRKNAFHYYSIVFKIRMRVTGNEKDRERNKDREKRKGERMTVL